MQVNTILKIALNFLNMVVRFILCGKPKFYTFQSPTSAYCPQPL